MLAEKNLLMIERLGVNTDWAEKSKLAYAKVLRLLDPGLSGWEFKDSGAPAPPVAPPVPIPEMPSRQDVPPPAPSSDSPQQAPLRRQIL